MESLLDCGHPESPRSSSTGGVGYGIDSSGKKHCYACCAEQDKRHMLEHGKISLYLVSRGNSYSVTNWSSSLEFKVSDYRTSHHNWGLKRHDVWFIGPDNHWWHGVNVGDFQVCHCKRTKREGSKKCMLKA